MQTETVGMTVHRQCCCRSCRFGRWLFCNAIELYLEHNNQDGRNADEGVLKL